MNKRKLLVENRFLVRLVIVGLMFLFSSCAVAEPTEIPSELEAFSYQPVPTNLPEIEAIEGNAEIKLPPSAREIHAYTTGLRDIFIMVRFSMDARELSEFMKSTLCDHPLAKSTTVQESSGNKFDWWVPDQAQYSEECNGEKGNSHQQVIVDMSNSEKFIVYVSTSTY
ncbi:MAG TPA: hypothetical protein VFH34_12150 [Anaerolineales bacterium]|nr:hypothetical protein [Anaerolineales bacterium]